MAGSLTGCRQAQSTAEALPDKDIALQLYSIREVIGDSAKYADSHEEVFGQLRDMGYSAV